VGDVIRDEDDLLVASPELFRERFKIDVRTNQNVRRIIKERKIIEVENLTDGSFYTECYDKLVLSPGSEPLRPNLPGIHLPGVFTLWTIPDTREILRWISMTDPKRAVVVGGGFIGLEMAENLKKRNIHVTIVEMQSHVMPALDPEMGAIINEHLRSRGVGLCLGSPVSGFHRGEHESLMVALQSGKTLSADIIILSIGVRPRIELAKSAGLAIGESGGIRVDGYMKTNDESIWAVGDAVEVKDYITGNQTMVPLAGPASRQGRIAADAIFGKPEARREFRGVQATSVCGILGLTVASTGKTEKALNKDTAAGETKSFEKIYLQPFDHASYYPGAKILSMKLLFDKNNGRILGAQAVGMAGVEKRIDVIAMAIQKNGTVFDLEEAELCYAPQYGSARDPVNVAGMIAANYLRDYTDVGHWESLAGTRPFILDVRDPDEYEKEQVLSAVNIPLNNLRERLEELPKDQTIWVHCLAGQRSYIAGRILTQNGFRTKNLSGGFMLYPYMKQIVPGIP
jgi:NADPH-dependent 2,4-dienoyl-CoA reductase/sulfur reductase-like enzyme/rhodanese-related sulfurtransferase